MLIISFFLCLSAFAFYYFALHDSFRSTRPNCGSAPSERSEQLYRALNERIWKLEAQGMSSYQLRAESKKLKAEVDAELEPLWQRVARVRENSHRESTKHERYCREQRELLRALEDLAANERLMYELDNRKDQIMTVCKLATSESGHVGPRSLLSLHLCTCYVATPSAVFPATRAHSVEPGYCPRRTASFQQPTTYPRSARRLSACQRDPATASRW